MRSCDAVQVRRVRLNGQALLLRDSLGRAHRKRRSTSRPPFASRRCSGIRIAIRATRMPSTASRKSTRPTRSSRTPTNARPMTASATPHSSKAAWRPRRVLAPISPPLSPIFSTICSAWAARRGRGSGRERGADLRYNMEISLQEAYAGKTAQIRIPTSVTCEALLRHRRQGRHQAEDLSDVRRRRARSATPRASSRSSAPARVAKAAAR